MALKDDAPHEVEGSAEEIQDAEEVPSPAPPAQELVPSRPVGSTELIVADSPAERVDRATEVANALDAVIRAQGMRTKVGNMREIDPATGESTGNWIPRWHVNVEGWQTLATLLGLAVVPAWTRRVIDAETGRPERVAFTVKATSYPKGKGQGKPVEEREYEVDGFNWEARVEVFKDGVLIGAGEAMCSRTEDKWREADDYAVRGMAQTRATSRAIGAAARWIVTLAGYAATPAEEMPADAGAAEQVNGNGAPKLPTYLGPPQGGLAPALNRAIAFLIAPTDEDRESIDEAAIDEAIATLREHVSTKYERREGVPLGHVPIIVADAFVQLAKAVKAIVEPEQSTKAAKGGGKEKGK